MSKKFTWDAWAFDCCETSYVIAKTEVPDRNKVADYIIFADRLSSETKPDIEACISEGWCKWQVRSDWEGDWDNSPHGWYVVEETQNRPMKNGKPLAGWFPVWIIRRGEWY